MPSERYDEKGRERIECKECGGFFHRLEGHLTKAHSTTVEAYTEKHPGAPTISPSVRELARKRKAKGERETKRSKPVEEEVEEEPTEDEGFRFGCVSLRVRTDLTELDALFVPKHDEKWVMGANEEAALEALALGIEANANVLIVGPPGVGKSTIARELASIVNAPLRYLPINGELRVEDFMGGDQLVIDKASGQTVMKNVDGPLPEAGENGHWVLFDEFDSLPSHVGFILHGVLEENRKLTRANGKPVVFSPDFRVIATANTLGLGDDSGQFAGTAPMNRALLDRFAIVILVDYPEATDEVEMIVSKSGIDSSVAEKMVAVATKVREAVRNETSAADLSPRRLMMWAAATKRTGNARVAAKLTVTNRLSTDDRKFVEGIVQRYFGGGAS